MRWLGEAASIVSAWNILCEAVMERLEVFQVNKKEWGFEKLPPIPCRRKQQQSIRQMIPDMQRCIALLLAVSFDPENLGRWTPVVWYPESPGSTMSFFKRKDIDAYAFWMKPEFLPSYRHSVSEFIAAAAAIVNDHILYPLPAGGAGMTGVAGFEVDCDMEIDYVSGEKFYGRWSENGKMETASNFPPLIDSYLAIWGREKFTARCHHHKWHYFSGQFQGNCPYILPQMRNTGKLRCRVTAEDHNGKNIMSEIQEFEMDFSVNCALNELDFSTVSGVVDKVFSGRIADDNSFSGRRAVVSAAWTDEVELYLTEENFPELNYKFLE